jgi:membrane protease YdiL (CAAX protease family)
MPLDWAPYMTDDQQTQWLRLILFMTAMFLLTLVGPLLDIFYIFLMFIVTWVFVEWEGSGSIVELGLDVDKQFSFRFVIGVLAAVFSVGLVTAIAIFFGGQLRPTSGITAELMIRVITNAALFSFIEELTHRGYILTRAEKLVGRGLAIVLSSVFFSVLHFSWWGVVGFNILLIFLFSLNMFLGGVVLSISYYWSGRSLWAPIGFHFMWNVLAYTLFPSFPETPVIQPEIFQIEWGLTTIIGFLFALSILWGFLATRKNKE